MHRRKFEYRGHSCLCYSGPYVNVNEAERVLILCFKARFDRFATGAEFFKAYPIEALECFKQFVETYNELIGI
jgi:hypothetical protein